MVHTFSEICQESFPFQPWLEHKTRKLPGINPLEPHDWLLQDEVYHRQMAYRDHLIATRRDQVFDCLVCAHDIAQELLETIVEHLETIRGFRISRESVTRPDGVVVDINSDHPLLRAGRLVQEDLCLLKRIGKQHVLVGAILCFPASWLLAEKMGRPLTAIHDPVPKYDGRIASVVQRMFDNLKPEKIVYRGNFLAYDSPDLFQPRSVDDRRDRSNSDKNWIRVERQTLRKLPRTDGVVFGIHTTVCTKDKVLDLKGFWHHLKEKDL